MATGDNFGGSVAIAGDYIVTGATGNDDSGSGSGLAYVYLLSGTTWTQQAKLTAADPATGDSFGGSVAIAGDYIVTGAHMNDDIQALYTPPGSGSAYVYVLSGTTWTQQAKLVAEDAATGDNFGGSVAIAGNYIVTGAAGNDDSGSGSGSAYAFSAPTKAL